MSVGDGDVSWHPDLYALRSLPLFSLYERSYRFCRLGIGMDGAAPRSNYRIARNGRPIFQIMDHMEEYVARLRRCRSVSAHPIAYE